jgi:hypothetical protein
MFRIFAGIFLTFLGAALELMMQVGSKTPRRIFAPICRSIGRHAFIRFLIGLPPMPQFCLQSSWLVD